MRFGVSNAIGSKPNINTLTKGSGCGTVGRAVASNTRETGFESSHWQLLLNIYLLLTVCRKDGNKEKEAGNGPFKKTLLPRYFFIWSLPTV